MSMEVGGFSFDRITCDLWRTGDGRLVVRRIIGAETFCASVDDEKLRNTKGNWRRFRMPETAMKAAAASAKKGEWR
jgi:hypothetical protein